MKSVNLSQPNRYEDDGWVWRRKLSLQHIKPHQARINCENFSGCEEEADAFNFTE